MKKSNVRAREDRKVSCFGTVQSAMLVYIQVEIGFVGLRLQRATWTMVVSRGWNAAPGGKAVHSKTSAHGRSQWGIKQKPNPPASSVEEGERGEVHRTKRRKPEDMVF